MEVAAFSFSIVAFLGTVIISIINLGIKRELGRSDKLENKIDDIGTDITDIKVDISSIQSDLKNLKEKIK